MLSALSLSPNCWTLQSFSRLFVPGINHIWRQKPGEPEIPMLSIYLIVPQEVEPSLDYKVTRSADIEVEPIVPAPFTLALHNWATEEPTSPREYYKPDKEAYSRKKDPKEDARLVFVGEKGKDRLFRLDIFPVSYLPSANMISPAASVVAEVTMPDRQAKQDEPAKTSRNTKSCKENPAASASVSVTAHTSGIKRIRGFRDREMAISMATPVRRSMVVTLSKNAEEKAVKTMR